LEVRPAIGVAVAAIKKDGLAGFWVALRNINPTLNDLGLGWRRGRRRGSGLFRIRVTESKPGGRKNSLDLFQTLFPKVRDAKQLLKTALNDVAYVFEALVSQSIIRPSCEVNHRKVRA
jgi:hypothetical protein